MELKKIFAISLSTLLLTGCASKSTLTKEQKTVAYQDFVKSEKLEKVDKIQSFKLNGWSYLNDRYLILTKSVNRPYLIELRKRCSDLDYASAIKLEYDGIALRPKFDSISVIGGIEINCYIESIYELNKEQKKALQSIGKPEKQTEEKSD